MTRRRCPSIQTQWPIPCPEPSPGSQDPDPTSPDGVVVAGSGQHHGGTHEPSAPRQRARRGDLIPEGSPLMSQVHARDDGVGPALTAPEGGGPLSGRGPQPRDREDGVVGRPPVVQRVQLCARKILVPRRNFQQSAHRFKSGFEQRPGYWVWALAFPSRKSPWHRIPFSRPHCNLLHQSGAACYKWMGRLGRRQTQQAQLVFRALVSAALEGKWLGCKRWSSNRRQYGGGKHIIHGHRWSMLGNARHIDTATAARP